MQYIDGNRMVDGGVDDIKKVMSSASKKFPQRRSKPIVSKVIIYKYLAHRIQQPISKMRIRLFSNFLMNTPSLMSFHCPGKKQSDWLWDLRLDKFMIRVFGIGGWIRCAVHYFLFHNFIFCFLVSFTAIKYDPRKIISD